MNSLSGRVAAVAFAVSALVLSLSGQDAEAVPPEFLNLHRGSLALQGYDPVSYFSNEGPLEGQKGIELEVDGVRYRFASEINRSTFEANPGNFRPAFGGWCAWAMLDGDRVDVNPKTYKIYDGHLLLYYDGFFGDTLKRWNEKTQKTSEDELFRTASANWKDIQAK